MENIPIRQIRSIQKGTDSTARFSIRDVQTVMGGIDLFHKRHRHNFFFILALQKGEGDHEIDFKSHKASDYSVFLMRPGQVHQLELKAGSTGYIMEFNTAFYFENSQGYQRLRKLRAINFCNLEVARFNKLQATLTSIFQECKDQEDGYQEAIKANLDIFFIDLTRQSKYSQTLLKNTDSYTQERLDEFLELVELHIAEYKQVNYYTELMNLSHYQLNKITKSTIGKTSSELINEQIILEAKRFLLATSSQIKDIAYHLGYEDVSYFIRFFKKHTKHSPESFRHNFR